jgi:broad specificity phosphatase PhoE
MDTTLIFIRHGQTDWNTSHRLQGQTDVDLNAIGKKQAQQTARHLRHYPISRFIYSPLLRARQTAQIIGRYHKDSPSVPHDLLKERSFGSAEGMTYEEIALSHPALSFDRSWHHPYYQIHKGERLIDVYGRGKEFLHEVLANHHGATVCVIAHGVIIRCMISYLLDIPFSANNFFKLKNASLTIIKLPGQSPAELHVLNHTVHLD